MNFHIRVVVAIFALGFFTFVVGLVLGYVLWGR